MISTSNLIDSLAASATPVRRLRPPLLRASVWLVLALLILLLLGISHGLRPDFRARLNDPIFILGVAASGLTGVLAAISAFALSLPDRSRLFALMPLPSLIVWVSTAGAGCLTNWVSSTPDSLQMGEAVSCLATVVLTSLPLFLALILMLRHAAPLRPVAVTWMGGLAVGAFAASALALFHEIDATIMALSWNLGSAAAVVGLGALFGLRAFAWAGPRSRDRLAP